MSTVQYHFRRFLPLLILVTGSGCTVLQQEHIDTEDQLVEPEYFSQTGNAVYRSKWWITLEDEQLTHLIEQALEFNYDLRSRYFQIESARAIKAQAKSSQGPTVSIEQQAGLSTDSDDYYTTIGSGYELDLWGELESAYSVTDADFMASQQDYRAAAITLSSEVAITWFELVTAMKTYSVYQEQLSANEDLLALVQEQFLNGITRIADSTQQAAQVAASKAALAAQQAVIAGLKHSLNVLLGNSANEPIGTNFANIPELPPLPLTGIPSVVLAKRPDIQSQLLEIRSTQNEVSQAIASRYPSLSMGLNTESIALSASALFSNWTTNLIATLAVDIWNGGNTTAVVAEQRADARQAANDYAQLVLGAIQETEDALSNERFLTQQIAHLQSQRNLSHQALEQTRSYYINGTSDFSDLLVNLTATQGLDIAFIDAQQILLANRISLYRSLSSGWDIPDMSTQSKGNTGKLHEPQNT